MANKTMRERNAAGTTRQVGRWILPASKAKCVPTDVRIADASKLDARELRTCGVIAADAGSMDRLLRENLREKHRRRPRMRVLIAMKPPRPESLPALACLFDEIIGDSPAYRLLPRKELIAVVTGKERASRFIAAAADRVNKTLVLVRGDRKRFLIPFSYFTPSGDGTKPDFAKLRLADYGLTVALGDYEASADAVLYEFDPAYRRKLNKERIASERSFGAALRRLRLQRGLGRGDFGPVTSKTIARIERGEVERPHGKTLDAIAERLGVAVDEIETF